MLHVKHIGFTALDASSEHIDFLKKFGNTKIYYGDASRLELLRAARADKARIFVLAIDDVEASVRTAETVLQHFPHLTIFARARNRQHTYRLLNLGIKNVMRETYAGSLEMTGDILQEMGLTWSESKTAMERFRQHDEALLQSYKHHKDVKKLTELAKEARKDLEELFEKDEGKQKKSA
jgi:glutathione-regulated potassium-efflux system protein KefB